MKDWIKTEQELPKPGRVVIACGRDGRDNVYLMRAIHCPRFHREDEGEFQGDAEYNEHDDAYYWPEGWYETNHMEETAWMVNFPIEYWQALPELPKELQ